MSKRLSLVGQVFGRLTVIADAGSLRYKGRSSIGMSLCLCECGTNVEVSNSRLKSGHTKSCGCLQRETASLPYGTANDNLALARIKKSAATRGYVWALDDAYVRDLIAQPCHWCGVVRANTHPAEFFFNGRIGWNGLDRLDNSQGYIDGNVVSCCGVCNRMKGTLTEQAFVQRCAVIVSRHLPLQETVVLRQNDPCEPTKELSM